jgi:hypothetical protein
MEADNERRSPVKLKPLMIGIVLTLTFVMAEGIGRASTFSFDTSSLSGGPFYLNFQFIDGSGTNDANNVITITLLSGGIPLGVPMLIGGASGNLSTTALLVDSSFFNEITQQFEPGLTISFDVALTSNVDVGSPPDEFTFAILDSSFQEILTTDPTGGNVLLRIDINSSAPTVDSYAPVPEPSTILLLSIGLGGVAMKIRQRLKSDSSG